MIWHIHLSTKNESTMMLLCLLFFLLILFYHFQYMRYADSYSCLNIEQRIIQLSCPSYNIGLAAGHHEITMCKLQRLYSQSGNEQKEESCLNFVK